MKKPQQYATASEMQFLPLNLLALLFPGIFQWNRPVEYRLLIRTVLVFAEVTQSLELAAVTRFNIL